MLSMKLSDKFKNLGPSGLARRVAPEAPDDRRKPAKPRPAASPVVGTPVAPPKKADRVKRWREANPELYLERQRTYQARYKARKLAEKAKKPDDQSA